MYSCLDQIIPFDLLVKNLVHTHPRCASFPVIAVLSVSDSPVSGVKRGSVDTSLQTSLRSFAVRFLNSLCLNETESFLFT